jgi:exodeoxyribonuclease VII small subunit
MEEKLSYEAAIEELREILENLEEGEISIDILAEKVERASFLLQYCYDRLGQTEKKVKEIIEKLDL